MHRAAWLIVMVAAPAAAGGPPTGDFVIDADRPDAETFAQVAGRYGQPAARAESPPGKARGYQQGAVRWRVFVPRTWRPGRTWGLLVWISPTAAGMVPPPWRPALASRRLVWIGPDNAGNPVWTLLRHSLAVEAVRRMERLGYEPDPNRIYVAGFSGGGRIASHVALVHADIFTGGICMMGCNPYRSIRIEREKAWAGFWPRPDRTLLARARTTGRLVLMTGETDFNRTQTRMLYETYRAEGFRHLTYIEVPGIGHSYPGPQWLTMAVDALDKPIAEILAARAGRAGRPVGSRPAVPASRPVGERAAGRLQLGRAYLANGLKAKAREVLKDLVAKFPHSPQAEEARRLLEELKQ